MHSCPVERVVGQKETACRNRFSSPHLHADITGFAIFRIPGITTGRLSSDSHVRLYVSLYQWQQTHWLCVGMLSLELNGYRMIVGEEDAAQPCGG